MRLWFSTLAYLLLEREGGKDRAQGDGVGEGESGNAATAGVEGGGLCAGECAPESCGFRYGPDAPKPDELPAPF